MHCRSSPGRSVDSVLETMESRGGAPRPDRGSCSGSSGRRPQLGAQGRYGIGRGELKKRTLIRIQWAKRQRQIRCWPTESSASVAPVRFLRLSPPADVADHGSLDPALSQTASCEYPRCLQRKNYHATWDPCRGSASRLDTSLGRTVRRFASGR